MEKLPTKRKCTAVLVVAVLLAACGTDDAPANRNTDTEPHPDVIVIGAGLSGLYSAMQLEQAGLSVTVLEARNRIGGRLYTLDEIPGAPEAGGNVIGSSYARVIDTARTLGVELVPATGTVGGPRNQVLHVGGEFVSPQEWATWAGNPFPRALKALPPVALLGATLKDNPLNQSTDWLLTGMHTYDIPLSRHLEQAGLNERAQELAYQAGAYGSSADDASLLQLYKISAQRKQAMQIHGGVLAVKGGNQRLPEAMAHSLHGSVLTDNEVTHVHQDEEGVTVTVADGTSYRSDRVIATVPFPALRRIEIKPALPAVQQRAIDELSYSHVMQAHLLVKAPYSGDRPPSLWTDQVIERVFAFSADGSGEPTNAVIWINGRNAELLSVLPEQERNKTIMDSFYGIYPDAKGRVELQRVVDWGKDRLAGGSWADWSPGQISSFINVMSKPYRRLHFAGEHTAVTHPGMESAMESGERAAAEVISVRSTADVSAEQRAELLFMRCEPCHSIEKGEAHKLGPNLFGIGDSDAAAQPDYPYSEPLRQAGLRWDRATLSRWITSPDELVPGTAMIYRNTLNEREVTTLVDYLANAN